jgi:peptidoglycan/LPS O-acetylase OafA/YrhL
VLLARLSRRTTGGRWIPEIDGLRFLAIALVLADHAAIALNVATGQRVVEAPFGEASQSAHSDLLSTVFGNGAVGVLIFFMVSGFVLAMPLIKNQRSAGAPMPLWPYFRRRLARIEPPYLIVMTVLFAIAWLAGTGVGIGHLVASLAYLHSTYYGADNPVNGVAWSLEIEVQFYVLVPALALLLCAGRRANRRWRIVLLAMLATACHALGLVTAFAFLGSSIQYFLLGWLLADIYVADWAEAPRPGRLGDVVGCVAVVALLLGLAFVPVSLGRTVAPWLVFATGYAAFRGVSLRRALSNRWIATIGGMCYSIYLVHYALFIFLSRSLRPLASLPSAVAMLGACAVLIPIALVVGAIFFVLVERPFMDPSWPERLRERLVLPTGLRSRPGSEAIIVIPGAGVVEEASPR